MRRVPARHMTAVFRAALAGAALSVALLVAGCAAPLRDPWGLAVSGGRAPASVPLPRAVQADLGVTAHEQGALTLSARLYAEPLERYRLDIFGLFTPVAASWAWGGAGREGTWTLVRHDTREVVTGTGVSFVPPVSGGTPPAVPDVHALLGFLWGRPLPGFPGEEGVLVAADSGRVSWVHAGVPWRARFDPATGLCLEAWSPDMTLKYERHARHDGRVIPGRLQVWVSGARVLTLDVRGRTEAPVWSKDPFLLVVPRGYDSTALSAVPPPRAPVAP